MTGDHDKDSIASHRAADRAAGFGSAHRLSELFVGRRFASRDPTTMAINSFAQLGPTARIDRN